MIEKIIKSENQSNVKNLKLPWFTKGETKFIDDTSLDKDRPKIESKIIKNKKLSKAEKQSVKPVLRDKVSNDIDLQCSHCDKVFQVFPNGINTAEGYEYICKKCSKKASHGKAKN